MMKRRQKANKKPLKKRKLRKEEEEEELDELEMAEFDIPSDSSQQEEGSIDGQGEEEQDGEDEEEELVAEQMALLSEKPGKAPRIFINNEVSSYKLPLLSG